jgi:hypothetical protein
MTTPIDRSVSFYSHRRRAQGVRMIERRSVPENKYYVAVNAADLDLLEAEIVTLRNAAVNADECSDRLLAEVANRAHFETSLLAERDRLRELLREARPALDCEERACGECYDIKKKIDAALGGEGQP